MLELFVASYPLSCILQDLHGKNDVEASPPIVHKKLVLPTELRPSDHDATITISRHVCRLCRLMLRPWPYSSMGCLGLCFSGRS